MKRSNEEDREPKMAHNEMDYTDSESDSGDEMYIPDKNEKELAVDMNVYDVFYELKTPWPCLTFDMIDNGNKKVFPWSIEVVAGASSGDKLSDLYSIELSQIYEVPEEDEPFIDPLFECKTNKVVGDICRIKIKKELTGVLATQFEIRKENKSIFSMDVEEGFGLEGIQDDWLVGSCNGALKHVQCTKAGYLQRQLIVAESSIEDIKASPNEQTVFATAQGKGYFNIWDTRLDKPGMSQKLADCDINVMDWNTSASLILLGMDDGSVDIFDLRCFDESLAHYDWHKSPINALEWHPYESTSFAVCSDEQVTVWDCSVEEADQQIVGETKQVPPQLMFIHQGQECIRDVHWHKSYGCLVSSALDGFNVFKTFNME